MGNKKPIVQVKYYTVGGSIKTVTEPINGLPKREVFRGLRRYCKEQRDFKSFVKSTNRDKQIRLIEEITQKLQCSKKDLIIADVLKYLSKIRKLVSNGK